MVLDHLQQAERHVAEGERHLARQKEIVAELPGDGHDARAARALLAQFEDLLALHIADRDRIRAELVTATEGASAGELPTRTEGAPDTIDKPARR
jgi:hypothetical protein